MTLGGEGARGPASSVEEATQLVRRRLEEAGAALGVQGVAVPELRGKLLRPLLAYAFVPPDARPALDDRFWVGALAIQMVHEASLLHDDIVDGAGERRGEPTLSAAHGIGTALVMGDHYLTGAYRAAMAVGSPDFLGAFIVAVERTVAGEVLQGSTVGRRSDLATYLRAVLGKSGALMGAAACLGSAVHDGGELAERASLGRQVGALYQQVDDLLDYCGLARTGKEALRDYRQRKWTWILHVADVDSFDLGDEEVTEAIFRPDPVSGRSAAERSLLFLKVRRDALLRSAGGLGAGGLGLEDGLLAGILDGWLWRARAAVSDQVAAVGRRWRSGAPARRESGEGVVVAAAAGVGGRETWGAYFGAHARTFSLAARLFPPRERRTIEGVYAYCRLTDDLVDEPSDGEVDPDVLRERLEVWSEMSRAAFEGVRTGVELLDEVMGDARSSGVAWAYPEALLSGVAMDLRKRRYADWKELERYTFCVAGSVGGWISQAFGVRDPDTLDRAHSLGHAMQLTNILRDVGEDLQRDRVYLPRALLDRHGLSVARLTELLESGASLPTAYGAAMEELIGVADAYYDRARPGMRRLPAFFRRPVAAAAEAYRGIHREVRGNEYDNLRRRARTSGPTKIVLGAWGLARVVAPLLARPRSREGFAT